METVEFRNENFRWRINLKDADGTIQMVDKVQFVGAVFYGEFSKETWLRCAYPQEAELVAITKATDDTAFFIEVTPDMTKEAPLGVIILELTYRVEDTRFASGFKQFIKKGKFMRIVNSR